MQTYYGLRVHVAPSVDSDVVFTALSGESFVVEGGPTNAT